MSGPVDRRIVVAENVQLFILIGGILKVGWKSVVCQHVLVQLWQKMRFLETGERWSLSLHT